MGAAVCLIRNTSFHMNLYKIPEMSLAKLSFNSRALYILVCWTRKWLRIGVKIAVPIRVEIGNRG